MVMDFVLHRIRVPFDRTLQYSAAPDRGSMFKIAAAGNSVAT
jgi:hypothetical protein